MKESEGYPFVFQMIDRDSADEWLIETLQYRFKSAKSHHSYIVRVERYQEHAYCVKFFDKANMNSKLKFSLRTNTFEPRIIFYTLFHIMLDVLKRDSKASFFFVGAEDENDELGMATRRFRVYKKFTTSVVSERLFKHNMEQCIENDSWLKSVSTKTKFQFTIHIGLIKELHAISMFLITLNSYNIRMMRFS